MTEKKNTEFYKVYLFYLDGEPGLYAFTIDKKIKKKFLAIRNKKCFHSATVTLYKEEYDLFYRKNITKILAEYPLGAISDLEYYLVPMTASENAILNEKIDEIEKEMYRAFKELTRELNGCKKKYRKACDYITDTNLFDEKSLELNSKINTFRVFVKVFANTLENDYQGS